MGILSNIVTRKKEKLKDIKAKVSLRDLKSMIGDIEDTRDFKSSIKRTPAENIKFIAEIKRASPSKGIIRQDFDHLSIAAIYEKKRINAVSVLTEEDFFQGKLRFISDVKKILTKPILRKDFIFDEYQIYESRAYKADAILLIAALLDKHQAYDYLQLSKELGLSVLFEVHNFEEIEIALHIDSNIIGINNRDLNTLHININTTFDLIKEIPSHKVIVSESGINTHEDVKRLQDQGIDSLLIGTAFMEADDIGRRIDEFVGQV